MSESILTLKERNSGDSFVAVRLKNLNEAFGESPGHVVDLGAFVPSAPVSE